MKYLLFFSLALMVTIPAEMWAKDKVIKREVRSVWMATVWAIDWPANTGTSDAVATKQKTQMTNYLNKLKSQNFNAIYFQVRSMCDAMYKSSYEPWSSYLTGTRGAVPAWDPLKWVVSECHKRGIECHAWVNPYRWATSASGWSTAQDKALKDKKMLLTYVNGSTTTTILNPALKETNERICNVCKEIITNYDVDGIVFDDYFYPSGIPTTSAAEDYTLWQNSGSGMTFANWRRDNVNKMVAAVYNTIQETKPYVKFGISPAGVACSSASVAATHGVEPCYAGSDWQYNSIFSDPVQWLQDGTIDYISPQIYWRTDHSTNPFGPITQWWSKVAKKFNRHHYASHSVSALATSGNNNQSYWDNYCQQVQYSRDYTETDAPGCVFYSVCNVNGDMNGNKASGLGDHLLKNKFQHPALTPAIDWKDAYPYGQVTNLQRTGTTLTWDNVDNVRFSVYAIPDDYDNSAVETSESGGILADYLAGISYSNSFTLADKLVSGYHYAVCVLDHYGNEFKPRYSNENALPSAPKINLMWPNEGASIESDFTLQWEKADVESYRLEVASNLSFTNIVLTASTDFSEDQNSLSYNALLEDFASGTYYWRVISQKEGCEERASDVRSFEIKAPVIEEGYNRLKDQQQYEAQRNIRLENRWIRSVKENYNNISFASTGSYNQGFCVINDTIYVSGRITNAAKTNCYMNKYDATSGALIEQLPLSNDVQCSTYPCNDALKDDAGNLLTSNNSLKISSYPLKLHLINKSTGEVTLMAECLSKKLTAGRVEHCTVEGDVRTGTFTIYAPVSSANTVARWSVSNGEVTELDPISISQYSSNATKTGMSPRLFLTGNGQFVLNSSTSVPTLYAEDGAMADTLNANVLPSATQGISTNGFTSFAAHGNTYALYPITDHSNTAGGYTFMLGKSVDNLSLSAMKGMWTLPEEGLGTINSKTNNAQADYEISATGDTVKIYIFVPGDGLAAYRLIIPYTMGDTNHDRVINVGDLTNVVGMIMNNYAEKDNIFYSADMNEDDLLNVGDLTKVVEKIMSATPAKAPQYNNTKNLLAMNDLDAKCGQKDVSMVISMNNEDEISALQFDLTLPEGIQMTNGDEGGNIIMKRTSSKKHTCLMRKTSYKTQRIMMYSNKNATFSRSKGKICTLSIDVDDNIKEGVHEIELSNIVLSKADGTVIQPVNVKAYISIGKPTKVSQLQKAENAPTEYYNLQGQKLTTPQKGINIVRYADGTTRKVFIK